MPRLRIRDTFGYTVECCSTNPITVALWLYEHAQKGCSENAAVPGLMLEVWPLYDSQGRKDWKPGHEVINMDKAQTQELMDRLYQTLWPKEPVYDMPEDAYGTLREMRRIQEEAQRRNREQVDKAIRVR